MPLNVLAIRINKSAVAKAVHRACSNVVVHFVYYYYHEGRRRLVEPPALLGELLGVLVLEPGGATGWAGDAVMLLTGKESTWCSTATEAVRGVPAS
jgi:hypothetical protein